MTERASRPRGALAEGLLIDAVGAVIAFVMLDVAVTNPQGSEVQAWQLGSIVEFPEPVCCSDSSAGC